ncbi:MAG: phosphate ABC transporter substrate-binding protein [Candidatus Aminicenantes bacterium]|nr:phosphate ABC transporter substrate-binding protein [Candidatus Aminicenantes bacterium]
MSSKTMKIFALAQLALAVFGGTLLLGQKMLQVKGSDTMVNLVQILAEKYMDKNPKQPIAVLGGGSGTGVTGMINGTCEIANTSRDWRQKEIDMAWEKGIRPRFFAVAIDSLSVIVNGKNPLNELTIAQVGAIYRGEVKNWKAVGGPDMKVSLYGRQSNSGTYVFFLEHVLGNKPYTTDMKEMNGNAQIIEGVITDGGGIGYVGVGYIIDQATGKPMKGLKVLNIKKDDKAEAFSPLDKAAVDSGAYPVSRPLWMATSGSPKGTAAGFLAWIVSPEGQKVVEAEGFYPVGGKLMEQNLKNLK